MEMFNFDETFIAEAYTDSDPDGYCPRWADYVGCVDDMKKLNGGRSEAIKLKQTPTKMKK